MFFIKISVNNAEISEKMIFYAKISYFSTKRSCSCSTFKITIDPEDTSSEKNNSLISKFVSNHAWPEAQFLREGFS
jgi:hypothetical protein